MPVFEITGVLLVLGIGWLFLDGARAREIAVAAARRACEVEGLQFLDDTVAGAGLALERDDAGQVRLRRSYTFEFSETGDNRRPGRVVMLGHDVVLLNVNVPRPSNLYTLH